MNENSREELLNEIQILKAELQDYKETLRSIRADESNALIVSEDSGDKTCMLKEDGLSKAILEQAGESIVVCNREGIIIKASNKAIEICGRNPLSKPFAAMFPLSRILPGNVPGGLIKTGNPVQMDELFRERKWDNVEVLYARDDGGCFYLIMNGRSLLDDDDRVTGYVIILADITERKQMESALRESGFRLKLYLENSPLALLEWDADFNLIQWSRKAEQMFGWTKEEILGKHFKDVNLVVEHNDSVDHTIERLLHGTETMVVTSNRNITKSGKIIDCIWYNSVLPGQNGQILSGMSLVLDVTERMEVENALRESEERYYTMLASIADAVISTDNAGRITFMNHIAEHLTGWPLNEASDKSIDEVFNIINTATRVKYDNLAMKVIGAKMVPGQAEQALILRQKDGEIPIEYSGAPIEDKNGFILGVVFIFRDISLRKASEEEVRLAIQTAETANKAKGEFIANMSHELRTPLNAILGYAQILNKSSNLNPRQRAEIDGIYNGGRHLLNMINELLDFSKIEAGKLHIKNSPFNLPALLKKVYEVIQILSKEKNLNFKIETKTDLPVNLMGDETRIQQVLINLLNNAVKFTQKGKVILRVDTVKSEEGLFPSSQIKIRFEVIDTGEGIPPDKLEAIFNSFEQLTGTRIKTKGTGLGLSISRRLVQLMRGELTVESKLGKGSIFSFEIPLVVIGKEFAPGKKINASLSANEVQESPQIIPPPAEELTRLLSFGKNGDIIQIRKDLEQMEQSKPGASNFITHMKQLAKNVDINGIIEFLNQYIKE